MQEEEAAERRAFLEEILREDEGRGELLSDESEEVKQAVYKSCDFGLRLGVEKHRAVYNKRGIPLSELEFEREHPFHNYYGFYQDLFEPVYNRLMNNPILRRAKGSEIEHDTLAYSVAAQVSDGYVSFLATKKIPDIAPEELCSICRVDPLLPHLNMLNEDE